MEDFFSFFMDAAEKDADKLLNSNEVDLTAYPDEMNPFPVAELSIPISAPTEFVVVDADGRVMSRTDGTQPPNSTMPPPFKKKNGATVTNLARLEDAIFEHGDPYRVRFLDLIKKDTVEFSEYLAKHTSRRHEALRYCWNTLNWRPSTSGKRVYIKNPANPYDK